MDDNSSNVSFSFLDIITFVLSIYVLCALMIDTFFKLKPQVSEVLNYFDTFICAIFLVDFSWRLIKASNKLNFLKWGWIDLISSIPAIGVLRIGRIVRVIRIIRILRAFKAARHLFHHISKDKVRSTLSTVFILTILLIIFSSISILQVETDPNSNIKTAEDAIWWSYTTITTVGYGDKFPVTTEGRIIGMFLMTAGVGLFGTFTAFIASKFVENKSKED